MLNRRESFSRQNTWPRVFKSEDTIIFTIPASYEKLNGTLSTDNSPKKVPSRDRDIGSVNPDLYIVEKYDRNISDGIPDGLFASTKENDFPKGHRGRIWFTLIYNKKDETLKLSLLKGRNFCANPENDSETATNKIPDNGANIAQKILRKKTGAKLLRTESLPEKSTNDFSLSPKTHMRSLVLRGLNMARKNSEKNLTQMHPNDPSKNISPKPSISIIKLNKEAEENLIVKIYLLPDARLLGQARCKRGLPDPVFAERFIFQISEESLSSRSLKMVFALVDKDGKHEIIGEVVYHISRGIKNAEVVYEDLQPIPSKEPTPGGIDCEIQISLCYNTDLSRITIVVLRAIMKVPDQSLKDLACRVEININFCEKSTKSKMGKLCHQKSVERGLGLVSNIASSPTLERKATDGFNTEFDFNETFKFPIESNQFHAASVAVNIRLKSDTKEICGMVVIGAFMFAHKDGFEHWEEMINRPKEFSKRWHKLVLL